MENPMPAGEAVDDKHSAYVNALADALDKFFNCSWLEKSGILRHYCCTTSGARCHETDDGSKSEANSLGDKVASECVDGLTKPSKNRWKSREECNRRLALGSGMANVLAGAFVATIGSKKRLREVDQEEDDASTDGKLSAAKRLKKSAEHVSNPDTVASSMSQSVRTVPLDKNTFFEQEKIASDAIAEKSSACPEDHPKALLLQ